MWTIELYLKKFNDGEITKARLNRAIKTFNRLDKGKRRYSVQHLKSGAALHILYLTH